ncbi:MAG: response regulator [Sedimentisphaerales bacterium]|jgi:CheY-like chemotaxis protein
MRSSRPILLVDDDNAEMVTVKRALKELNVPNELVHHLDGENALNYLRNNAQKGPCVILLDLNMPKMKGTDFLAAIKADAELKQIPVIILTVSNNEDDQTKCFDLCAAGYIVKPATYEEFIKAMDALDAYWTLSELSFPDP